MQGAILQQELASRDTARARLTGLCTERDGGQAKLAETENLLRSNVAEMEVLMGRQGGLEVCCLHTLNPDSHLLWRPGIAASANKLYFRMLVDTCG